MKNEKYDDIKAFLSKDVDLPESLSKENVVKMLKTGGDEGSQPAQNNVKAFEKKKKKSSALVRIAASAAAFIVVAVGAFAVYNGGFGETIATVPAKANDIVVSPKNETDTELFENTEITEKAEKTTVASSSAEQKKPEQKPESEASKVQQKPEKKEPSYEAIDLGLEKCELSNFKSEKDMNKYLLKIAKKFEKMRQASKSYDMDGVTMAAVSEGSSYIAQAKNSGTFAKTNTRVDGVDESDIIKTDGRYIYIVKDEYLSIIDGETMELACQRKLRSTRKNAAVSISEIYLNGDSLVVMAQEYEKDGDGRLDYFYGFGGCGSSRRALGTLMVVFDVTDRKAPTEKRRVRQDGMLISSRMVGSCLYTATRYCPDYEKKSDYVPSVDGTKLSCGEVYIEDVKEQCDTYVVLSGFDTANENSTVSKTSILSGADEVFCSQDTFYVAQWQYDEKNDAETTAINSFSIENGAVAYKASGVVPGSHKGLYSMDQYGKYFRIVTDGYNAKTDKDFTNLYVLDEKLNVIGKLEDIAKNEQLKSARFMGDTAYVVTFKNTDPLFAIDLSKPNEPKLLGEVKLPGFSSYLHPISENLLVGIGYDGNEEEADMNTLKVSLFDVTDKKNPRELSSKVVRGVFFNIDTYSAKDFVLIDENTFGIPVRKDDISLLKHGDYTYREKLSFRVFTVKDGKITEKEVYNHGTVENSSRFFRGTFIGNNVFTVDERSVKKFDMESAKLLSKLSYETPEEKEERSESVTQKGDAEATQDVTVAVK